MTEKKKGNAIIDEILFGFPVDEAVLFRAKEAGKILWKELTPDQQRALEANMAMDEATVGTRNSLEEEKVVAIQTLLAQIAEIYHVVAPEYKFINENEEFSMTLDPHCLFKEQEIAHVNQMVATGQAIPGIQPNSDGTWTITNNGKNFRKMTGGGICCKNYKITADAEAKDWIFMFAKPSLTTALHEMGHHLFNHISAEKDDKKKNELFARGFSLFIFSSLYPRHFLKAVVHKHIYV